MSCIDVINQALLGASSIRWLLLYVRGALELANWTPCTWLEILAEYRPAEALEKTVRRLVSPF